MATTTGLTIDDFERLPAEAAKNKELVDGELIDVSGNTPAHIQTRQRFEMALLTWLAAHPLGTVFSELEYDFQGNAHGPDVSYFGLEKQSLLDNEKRVQRFVPDLAIEIASRSDNYNSIIRKVDRYLHAGTAEVWLVSQENWQIASYTRAGVRVWRRGDILTTDLLPGFTLDLNTLFQGF